MSLPLSCYSETNDSQQLKSLHHYSLLNIPHHSDPLLHFFFPSFSANYTLFLGMASDESMNILSSSMQEDEFDYHDTDIDAYDHSPHPHNLSRLSMCTSSMYTLDDDEHDLDASDGMRMFMSRLSIESFDADEEFSDEKEVSSDSDKGCYSLPATPRRRRTRAGLMGQQGIGVKEYASENETQRKSIARQRMKKNLRRRRKYTSYVNTSDESKKKKEESYGYCNSFSGESEGCGGSGLVVITRPKGGRRSLCMDMEEVKACRDLGFELEHERMLEMPNRVSISPSLDTASSGGNSPIANWRISSPGDDPREVKARLKVWAQAVALASTYRHGGGI